MINSTNPIIQHLDQCLQWLGELRYAVKF